MLKSTTFFRAKKENVKSRVDIPPMRCYNTFRSRCFGSVGRAHRSHRWGHWFESSKHHQIKNHPLWVVFYLVPCPASIRWPHHHANHIDGGLTADAACGGCRPRANGSSPASTTISRSAMIGLFLRASSIRWPIPVSIAAKLCYNGRRYFILPEGVAHHV